MARVERFTSQEQIPVQQAQLIDPSGFPADVSSAEALKVGADVANVFAELAKRRRDAQDSLAATAASKSRTLAELEMQQFIADNPDPDKWEEGFSKIYAKQAGVYASQKQSAKAKKEQDIEQQSFRDQLQAKVRLAATNQDIKNDIFESGANVIDLMSTDDGSPQHALEEMQAIDRYKAALERETTPEIAAIKMEETLKEGQKQQIENVKKDLMNRAAVRPELMKSFIDTELKARAKGKKGLDEFKLLSETDLEAVRDYANSVGEKAVSDSKIAADAAIKASYKNIINGGTNITEMAELILVDPTITDDDKVTAVNKIKTFFTTWNSAIKEKEEDIVTSNSTRIKALRIIKAVKAGKLTDDEGIEVYETLSKVEKINGIDGKQFINDIFAAGESARVIEKRLQNDILAGREKQLRDAIEKQQNILQPDLATEILKDFANIAVIELNDTFREGDFKKEDVDAEVDRLLQRFTLSEAQQQMAVNARSLRLAESLKEQQESITKVVASLRAEGKEDAAKRIMDEAIMLGIFISEDGMIKKGKKKTGVGRELIKRILDSIIE